MPPVPQRCASGLVCLALLAVASHAAGQSQRRSQAAAAPGAVEAAAPAAEVRAASRRGSSPRFGRRAPMGSRIAGKRSVPARLSLQSTLAPGRRGTGSTLAASLAPPRARAAARSGPAKHVAPAPAPVAPASASASSAPVASFTPSLVPALQGTIPRVSSNRPGLVLLMVDGSSSMENDIAGATSVSKANAAAEAVNNLIMELVLAHRGGDGTVRDRLHVAHVDYSSQARLGLGGEIMALSALADRPAGFMDTTDAAGDPTRAPYWVSPMARGQTMMHRAMEVGRDVVNFFVGRTGQAHPGRRLLLAFNVTDGAPNYDPRPALSQLVSTATQHGDAFLMTNIHISGEPGVQPILFPTREQASRFDAYGQLLFEMSSPVPAALMPLVSELNPDAVHGTEPRMMAVNANLDGLNSIIQAGSSLAMTPAPVAGQP